MKTALIIVDMQKGFINDNTKHLTTPIVDFIENNKFDLIVGTRYINHSETACYRLENWRECMEGTEDVEIVPEIARFCDVEIDKDTYSCWPVFKQKYRLNDFDKFVFVGVNTGCCVLHSVFDAHNDVVDTRVISDLCGSTSGNESHECALQILRECITKHRVIKSQEYC